MLLQNGELDRIIYLYFLSQNLFISNTFTAPETHLNQVLQYGKAQNIKYIWSFYQISGLKKYGVYHLRKVQNINLSVYSKRGISW